MKESINLKLVAPIAIFIAALAIGIYFTTLNNAVIQQERRMVTQQRASFHASEIKRILSSTRISTFVLAQGIKHSNGELESFDQVAKSVLSQLPGISNLQLAPSGIISDVYPLEGNESAIGHDLLRDDSRKLDAMSAIRDRRLTLAGPFDLVQGDTGVVGRYPVFIDQVDGEKFWGFTSALILLDDLFEAAGLQTLVDEQYFFELAKFNKYTQQETVFKRSGDIVPANIVPVQIAVPNGRWVLRVGCSVDNGGVVRLIGFGLSLLISLFLAFGCRKLFNGPEKLRELVATQTRDLHLMAYHDSLTGLPNRRCFVDVLNVEVNTRKQQFSPMTLLLIDLDFFKSVNDTLGHQAGDLLLVEAAERLRACLPKKSHLARLSGDEFTVLLTDEAEASRSSTIAQHIVEAFNLPFQLGDNLVQISASVGIAEYSPDSGVGEELLVCADYAMYEAKAKGRSSVSTYTIPLQQTKQRQMRLSNDLHRAVALNELELLYQPIFCTKKRAIRKAEALIRWNHPELGVISPIEFIPLAEQSGLIMEVGKWVFDQATIQAKWWREQYLENLQISVNVSPAQFRSVQHVEQWIHTLERANLPGSSILVEITENLFLDDSVDIKAQLHLLRNAGIELALDDFGTGYSSLSYLKQFDIDYVKIDRSFISNLTDNKEDIILCGAIIDLATKLGLRVVAEGVETKEQLELLESEGCHYSQGYLFSKPINARLFEERFLIETQVELTDNVPVAA